MPRMAFWHRAHSDKCFFQLLVPELTPVSLQESKSGIWNCHATYGHRKTAIFTSIVHGYISVIDLSKHSGVIKFHRWSLGWFITRAYTVLLSGKRVRFERWLYSDLLVPQNGRYNQEYITSFQLGHWDVTHSLLTLVEFQGEQRSLSFTMKGRANAAFFLG
jgi:hypothetical protein